MANIVLLGKCNLKCPYCFAGDFTASQSKDFDPCKLKEALDFVASDREVGLIGGEPLLYKNIDTVLDELYSDIRFSRVTLFTNGILIDKHIAHLSHPKLSILINVNSSEDIGKANFEKIDKNIALLIDANMKNNITLGINVYKEEQSFDEVVELASRYGFKRVRLSVCVPSDKKEGAISYFTRMKRPLFALYKKLKEKGIAPCPDCNIIPSCVYTQNELEFIKTLPCFSQREMSLLMGEGSVCSPIIDIYPDMSATRCFGCYDDLSVDISSFKSINDLKNYFFMWVDSKRVHIKAREECKDCYSFNTFACYGGCLCYKNK